MHCPHCMSGILPFWSECCPSSFELILWPVLSPFSPFFCLSLPWHPLFASSNLTWHGLTLRTTTWSVKAPAYVEATIRLLDTQVRHCHCGDVRGMEKVLMQQETLERLRPRSVGFRPVGHTYSSCIAIALLAEVWRSQKVRSMRVWAACA